MEEIKKLIIILKTKNISLEKAARKIGVSFQTLWNWINAKHEPSELALVQLRKFIKKHWEPQAVDRVKTHDKIKMRDL